MLTSIEICEIKSSLNFILVEEFNGHKTLPLFSFGVYQRCYEIHQDLHPFIPGYLILNCVVSVDCIEWNVECIVAAFKIFPI